LNAAKKAKETRKEDHPAKKPERGELNAPGLEGDVVACKTFRVKKLQQGHSGEDLNAAKEPGGKGGPKSSKS